MGERLRGDWPASHEPSDDRYALAMANGPAHPLGGFSSEHLLESAPHNHRTFAFARDQPGRVQRGLAAAFAGRSTLALAVDFDR
jgi:hypothetical protein